MILHVAHYFLLFCNVYIVATSPLRIVSSVSSSGILLNPALQGYIGEFEEVDDHRNGKIVIQLLGRLNKTGVISPRYNVQLKDMEKWVVKLLPSRQFGYIVFTTSAGIMDHEEARRKHVAGKILGFFY
jgi:ribosomal protein S8